MTYPSVIEKERNETRPGVISNTYITHIRFDTHLGCVVVCDGKTMPVRENQTGLSALGFITYDKSVWQSVENIDVNRRRTKGRDHVINIKQGNKQHEIPHK